MPIPLLAYASPILTYPSHWFILDSFPYVRGETLVHLPDPALNMPLLKETPSFPTNLKLDFENSLWLKFTGSHIHHSGITKKKSAGTVPNLSSVPL